MYEKHRQLLRRKRSTMRLRRYSNISSDMETSNSVRNIDLPLRADNSDNSGEVMTEMFVAEKMAAIQQ